MATQDLRTRTITGLMELNEKRCGTISEGTDVAHRVMKAVLATGKKGRFKLDFTVEPDKNDELALMISCEVTCTEPKAERKKAMIYHDADNLAFSKTDPRQLELLAEQEAEREERERVLTEANITKIGRGTEVAVG